MRPFEKILVDLDSGAGSVLARVALGFAVVPIFRALSGGDHGAWIFVAVFLGLLVSLRVIPAVLRHALPFSAEAKAIWAKRRQTAKQYDAYQWQKLFWIGLGLSLHAVLGSGLEKGELIVMLLCLIGGGAGLVLWQRTKAILLPQ